MRWSTLVDETPHLSDPRSVFSGGDRLIASRPSVRSLYETWENNQWNPQHLTFERDHEQWSQLPASLQSKLTRVIQTFVIGEYTGLDLLSPVMAGVPTETGLQFVATQIADEAKHSAFMFRLVQALWPSSDSEKQMLETAWTDISPSYLMLNQIESRLSRATLSTPGAFEPWIRQVTMFHLVTEGVLAFYGQRALVSVLARTDVLPDIRQGFVAMGRDEARHVSFGLEMLREGVAAGYAGDILDVCSEILPFALTVDYRPGQSSAESAAAAKTLRVLAGAARKRLMQLQLGRTVVDALMETVQTKADSIIEGKSSDVDALQFQ